MEFYDFNNEAYHIVAGIVKFNFYNKIKNTGIVFEEILEATNLVTDVKFYILRCNVQENIHLIRFKDGRTLMSQLIAIAQIRLEKLKQEEKELMKINDTELYGENRYYNDTEMNALGLSSLTGLLKHFENNKVL